MHLYPNEFVRVEYYLGVPDKVRAEQAYRSDVRFITIGYEGPMKYVEPLIKQLDFDRIRAIMRDD